MPHEHQPAMIIRPALRMSKRNKESPSCYRQSGSHVRRQTLQRLPRFQRTGRISGRNSQRRFQCFSDRQQS